MERTGYVLGALLLTSGVVHTFFLLATGGAWVGPVSLRKAATFGLAFGLTLITITWVTTFVRLRPQTRAVLLSIFGSACALEVFLISMQAWRHQPSHFNVATPFDALVTRFLAVGGVLLVALITTFTIASFRPNATRPLSMLVAVRAGFTALFASQLIGAAMIARGMMLVARGNAQAAYATGGWLKPSHAALMHGILVLPVIAWLISFANWPEWRRVRLTSFAVAGYFVTVLGVAAANVRGVDTLRPPLVLAGLEIVGAVMLVATGAIAVRAAPGGSHSSGIEHG